MPKYTYFCKDCDSYFEARHSLKESLKVCNLCGTSENINRVPSTVFITKNQENTGRKSKAGDLLKSTIEETRQEIFQEKEKLKNRMYDNDS